MKIPLFSFRRFIIMCVGLYIIAIVVIPSTTDSYTVQHTDLSTTTKTTLRGANTAISGYKSYLITEARKNNLSDKDILMLEEIIRRESNWNSSAVHINKNGSRDYSLFQVNNYAWQQFAVDHDLDYRHDWRDNIRLGIMIYKHNGITPWKASEKRYSN